LVKKCGQRKYKLFDIPLAGRTFVNLNLEKKKKRTTFIMETLTVDKEFGSAMGALFHQIITDMKVKNVLLLLF
jgi:hypothetical protein